MKYNDKRSYKDSHSTVGYGQHYDRYYNRDTYDSRVWGLEKIVITKILKKYFSEDVDSYLDFACGTGRVCEYLEDRAKNSTGVDVTEEMLRIARGRCKKTEFVLNDITENNALISKRFDLITGFRFFLNAEDKLKHSALKEVSRMLKKEGVFIINIHGNKNSIRHLPFLVRNILDKRILLNEMSIGELEKYLKKYNLKIVEIHGLSFMPVIFAKMLPRKIWKKIELFVYSLQIFNKYGIDLVIVIKHE